MIKEKTRGNLVVISGPSGAGKGTIVENLLARNKNLWCSISATSRLPRPGEKDKVNYYFLTKDEFEKKIKEDNFLEWAEYNGNYYGTPKDKINEYLNNGYDCILEIEIQGALKVKELVPDAIFIFIMPPTMKDLIKRLKGRNTEDNDKILSRFKRAYTEINEVTKYNYVVVNDIVSKAVEKIEAILLSERCRVDRIEDIYLENQEEIIHEELINKKLTNEDRNI